MEDLLDMIGAQLAMLYGDLQGTPRYSAELKQRAAAARERVAENIRKGTESPRARIRAAWNVIPRAGEALTPEELAIFFLNLLKETYLLEIESWERADKPGELAAQAAENADAAK